MTLLLSDVCPGISKRGGGAKNIHDFKLCWFENPAGEPDPLHQPPPPPRENAPDYATYSVAYRFPEIAPPDIPL